MHRPKPMAMTDKNKRKDKDRGKDKGNDNNGVSVNASGGVATSSSQSNQTVVNANNQVCAGDCAQTNQQVVTMDTTQTTLAGSQEFFGTPPTYWIDVVCTFDAPLYRTICDCTGHGAAGAPPVRKITLPPADICAFVISEETRVVQERERTRRAVARLAAGRPMPAPAAWPTPTPAAARSRLAMSAATTPTSPSTPVAARPRPMPPAATTTWPSPAAVRWATMPRSSWS